MMETKEKFEIIDPICKQKNHQLNFSNESDFIFVKDKDIYRKVLLKNILFIKADGVYSEVHTIDQKFLASNCLSKVLKQLNTDIIMRCHRSYAVNINRVDAFIDSMLVVGIGKNKMEVPVGLKFKNAIFQRFPVLRSQ